MSRWRDIPARFEWDGESMVLVDKKKGNQGSCSTVTKPAITPMKPVVEQSQPVQQEVVKPSMPAVEIPARVEETTVILTPEVQTTPILSPPPLSSPVSTSTTYEEDLFSNIPAELLSENSPIYPEGRPVTNPNHLMLFLWNGGEVRRKYVPTTGWVSFLWRPGGKENPLPEKLIEPLIKANTLIEIREGVYNVRQTRD